MDNGTEHGPESVELTLTVRDIDVSVNTLEFIQILAHKDEYPIIQRVIDEHGLRVLALAHHLVKDQADGEITIRQIASLTGLSTVTAYDLVEALYKLLDLSTD